MQFLRCVMSGPLEASLVHAGGRDQARQDLEPKSEISELR